MIRRILATADLSDYHARQVQNAYARRGKKVPLTIPMRGGLTEEVPE